MSNAQKKFEEASEKFMNALKNLEKITLTKIDEISNEHKMPSFEEIDERKLQSKVLEQEKIINNLSFELNNIQKTIKEVGKENDFLKDKNHLFADKIFKFKAQGSRLIQAVEDDLTTIRAIIKNDQS